MHNITNRYSDSYCFQIEEGVAVCMCFPYRLTLYRFESGTKLVSNQILNKFIVIINQKAHPTYIILLIVYL